MPTAGRLTAAVLFAALFGYAAMLAAAHYRAAEAAVLQWLVPISIGMAVILGWRIAGARAGRSTWMGAVSYGLTAMVAIVFCVLFLASSIQMVQQSLRMRYDGPAEAIIAVFQIMFDNALIAGQPDVLLTLVAGSVAAGLATEIAGRNFS